MSQQIKHTIHGQLKSRVKIDFEKADLAIHATVNNKDVAVAKVDKKGGYELSFDYEERLPSTSIRVLPASMPDGNGHVRPLAKVLYSNAFKQLDNRLVACADLRITPALIEDYFILSQKYHMHGCVYAAYEYYMEPIAAARLEFFEIDKPLFPWLSPEPSEQYLGEAQTDKDGQYQFDFRFPRFTLPYPPLDRKPDIRVRISQFTEGSWQQVFEGPVDWDIATDFRRDFVVPGDDVVPSAPTCTRPDTGFRYISIGAFPIDDTRISGGYATSASDDQAPVPIVRHQPFFSTLRIFGIFADNPPLATYKVLVAQANALGPTGSWEDVTDPLVNWEWSDVNNRWEVRNLGPDANNHYRNIDGDPEANWSEHSLKVTWNTRNVQNGYYALRIVGYASDGTQIGAFDMQVIRVDNTMPEVSFDIAEALEVGDCGQLVLPINRKIPFRVTAFDNEGHMLSYRLSASRGKAALSAGDTVVGIRPQTDDLWTGINAETVEYTVDPLPASLADCERMAYHFHLRVDGAPTNGYRTAWQYTTRSMNLCIREP